MNSFNPHGKGTKLQRCQPSKREEGNSDDRQDVIMALTVVHIGYFMKREKLLGVGIRQAVFVSNGYHKKVSQTGWQITKKSVFLQNWGLEV